MRRSEKPLTQEQRDLLERLGRAFEDVSEEEIQQEVDAAVAEVRANILHERIERQRQARRPA